MKYKQIETANGRIQYWVNGKMTAKDKIPEDILRRLEPGTEIEIDVASAEETKEQEPVIKPEDRKCFIDGEPGKFKKFLEGKMVYLCEEHQHGLTTGEVVYEMRKYGLLE